MACGGGCGPGCCGDDVAAIQVGSGAPRLYDAGEPVIGGGQAVTTHGYSSALSLTQAIGRITPVSLRAGVIPVFEGGSLDAAPAVSTAHTVLPRTPRPTSLDGFVTDAIDILGSSIPLNLLDIMGGRETPSLAMSSVFDKFAQQYAGEVGRELVARLSGKSELQLVVSAKALLNGLRDAWHYDHVAGGPWGGGGLLAVPSGGGLGDVEIVDSGKCAKVAGAGGGFTCEAWVCAGPCIPVQYHLNNDRMQTCVCNDFKLPPWSKWVLSAAAVVILLAIIAAVGIGAVLASLGRIIAAILRGKSADEIIPSLKM